jgi:hypothetical protein
MTVAKRIRLFVAALACVLASVAPARTQGVQTGTLSGTVTSPDHLALPGVTVSVTSPSLQGTRETVSDTNGVYFIGALPPGAYAVTFTMGGFQTDVRDDVPVNAGSVVDIGVMLRLAKLNERVTVTAAAPSPLAQPMTSQTFGKKEIDALPIGRRPVDIAELAPSVTANVFSPNQVTIAGGFGFDSVFMVNGVDVNDTVFGTPNNLFIEDAVQETTVMAHGISAEYGRFSGGVVNVITKSGGNLFSGSFREGLTNPAWIEETPLEKASGISHQSVLGKTHEGTFGGPIVRDRLWFFAAGRLESTGTPNTLAQNGAAYTRTDTNRRAEGKVTATFAPAHTVQASYIDNWTEQANVSAVSAAALIDARTLTTRQLPNRLFGLSYNGQLTGSLLATVQFSDKLQAFRNNGGTGSSLADSPFISEGAMAGVPGGLYYNAPMLDASDPEQRNNQQIGGSLTYLAATPALGTHQIKGGGEYFASSWIGGNSQSSTGSIFFTDYLTQNGAVVRDASGSPIPVFTPGVSEIWTFQPIKGAALKLKTISAYAQDRWVATPRLTLDLGTRIETARSTAPGSVPSINATTIVPRLAASFDLQSSGATVLYATYGHYSGKYNQLQFAANTNVGIPNEIDYFYSGPAGQGKDFAPAFDMANYTTPAFAGIPTLNVQLAKDLHSPLTREFTAGIDRQLGRRGDAKATYAWRRSSEFIEDFISLSNGLVSDPLAGTLTNKVLDNTDALYREYQAIIVQSNYRPVPRVTLDGSYTLQLRNNGNFSGETANIPGNTSIYGNFPEITGPALDRLVPDGRLDNYQQHKMRLAATYQQPLGRFGALSVAPLWRVNSGGVYSLTSSIRIPAAQFANNPGYPTTDIRSSSRETVYFGERGAYTFRGYGVVDLATTYDLAVWKSARPFLKLEMFNLLNDQKQIAWDKTVSADAASAVDANGIPTGYIPGPKFGQATNGNQFPQPFIGQNGGRAIRIAFGARF